ncbi:MAG: winged helix-turn-helix domain-containing protein [Pyrinomonadaceae bacterium]
MQKLAHEIYAFDEFRLDITRGSLFRGTLELKLRPKSFEVLKYLTENQGRLVSKDELIEIVWQGMAVTDDSLVQCMKDIRHVLGDDTQQIIKTVPRRGYIFEKEVSENGQAVYVEETSGVHLVFEESEETNGHGDRIGGQPQLAVGRKSLIGTVKRHKLVTALALTALLFSSSGIAYGVFVFLRRPAAPPFKSVSIKRLTNDGKAVGVTISPDGKYFAYVTQDGGKESLWVRQIAAVNSVKIAGPAEVGYGGLTFSSDSNFLYYLQGGNLYQTGTLGGSTRKVLENVDTRVTFSPDGKRIAFVRTGQGDGKGSSLVLVNADGSGEEQILAWRKPPEAFTVNGCAWSPDGATIVCPAGDNALFGQQFPLAVRVADGNQTTLTKKSWNLVRPSSWLQDGSGFVMSAWDSLDSGAQLWHVTYPGGVPTRIYSDLNDYQGASLTADGGTLLVIQRQPQLTDSGTFRIPALSNGIYTVTVSSSGFKTVVVENVKIDVDMPASVNVALEVGSINETVTIDSGAEVLQRETATVGSTITGRQIIETPIPSRKAMDLISMLPGTATVGRPRNASVNGLPKGALSITIDGVDVQDNFQRSFEGYLARIVPRIDSIEEVTLSTSNPGSESGRDGAIQIRFVTKRGTNEYKGSLFYQHRNEALNSNYWFVNRDRSLGVDENGKALRQKIRLHQYGANLGGPIPLPRFGDGGGPYFSSGKNRAFVFFNYEQFRLPESLARTRTILTPAAQSGMFSYITGGQTQTVNLYNIAAANNQLATPDPTIASVLARIRAAVATTGSVRPIVNSAGAVSDPNRLLYDFAPAGNVTQKYLTLRFDVNVTKNHSFEFILNRQRSVSEKEFVNGIEERFPGFPSYGQTSNQYSYSSAVRSTLSEKL